MLQKHALFAAQRGELNYGVKGGERKSYALILPQTD